MQVQRVVSRTETYTTQQARTGVRSDGAGGTERYTYTEDVERTRVVSDVVTEEVADPIPVQDVLLDESEMNELIEAEALDADEPAAPPEPMTPEEAIVVLDRDFEVFDAARDEGEGDGLVRLADLEAVADDADDAFTQEQQRAAQALLDSPAYRNLVDVGAGVGRVDGTFAREDVARAVETIATGTYLDELIDTANGVGGRDGFVGAADVTAALADPGLSDEMTDALELMLVSTEGRDDLNDALAGLTTAEIAAASGLVNTAEYATLTVSERRLVADAFRDSGGDAAVAAELRALIESPDFSVGTEAERSAGLTRVALLNSSELAALPASDQTLVQDALAAADPADLGVAESLLGLLDNDRFSRLPAATQTAVLSQAMNYPSSEAVFNLERLLDKAWFRNQDVADQQRSAKLVAHLSDHAGDEAILDNTLDRLLSPSSNYVLRWEPISASPGNVTLGSAGGRTLRLNEDLVPADNNPVVSGDLEARVIENTTAHEISHLVNGDRTNQTFEYLNEEYRAWYVGHVAEHGQPPSNEEAMGRWEYFLNPNGGYADYAHGIDTGWIFDIGDVAGALDEPAEADQIFDLLSELSGLDVTEDNYLTVMGDPSSWTTNPADPASDTVFPATDDLDN